MATSTLIQKLDRALDPLVAGTVGSTSETSDRAQTETFRTAGAVAIGDWVALDSTQTTAVDRCLFVTSAANVALGNPLVVGVAVSSTTSVGGLVKVVVGGFAPSAKVVAGVAAAGVPLVVVASAPSAEAQVAANIAPACGVSLAASAAGVAPVWVIKQF